MKQRHELDTGRAERQHRGRMMMADRADVRACLIDPAVDHHLAVEAHLGRHDRLGIERHFQNVGWLDQLGGAMARNKVAVRICRVAGADMAERVGDAFIGEDAVGDRGARGQFGMDIDISVFSPTPSVIPGRRKAANPETITIRKIWVMGPGFSAFGLAPGRPVFGSTLETPR